MRLQFCNHFRITEAVSGNLHRGGPRKAVDDGGRSCGNKERANVAFGLGRDTCQTRFHKFCGRVAVVNFGVHHTEMALRKVRLRAGRDEVPVLMMQNNSAGHIAAAKNNFNLVGGRGVDDENFIVSPTNAGGVASK